MKGMKKIVLTVLTSFRSAWTNRLHFKSLPFYIWAKLPDTS